MWKLAIFFDRLDFENGKKKHRKSGKPKKEPKEKESLLESSIREQNNEPLDFFEKTKIEIVFGVFRCVVERAMGNASPCATKDQLDRLRNPVSKEMVFDLWKVVTSQEALHVGDLCPHCNASLSFQFDEELLTRLGNASDARFDDGLKTLRRSKRKICASCQQFSFTSFVEKELGLQLLQEIASHVPKTNNRTVPKRSQVEEIFHDVMGDDRQVVYCCDILQCMSELFRTSSLLDTWLINYDARRICEVEDASVELSISKRLEIFYEIPAQAAKAYHSMTKEEQRAYDERTRSPRNERVGTEPLSDVDRRQAAGLRHHEEYLAAERARPAPKEPVPTFRRWGNVGDLDL